MKTSEAIDITKRINENAKKEEIISADFVEIDILRRSMREVIKEIQKRAKKKMGRQCYEYCTVYVGRHVTSVRFFNINIPYYRLKQLISTVKTSSLIYNSDYKFYLEPGRSNNSNWRINYRTIKVYLRGDKK